MTYTCFNNLLSVGGYWTVDYGNGLYVAGTDTSTNSTNFYTSNDGVTWTLRTLPVSARIQRIRFGNNLFIMTLASSNSSYLTSPDGLTWTSRPVPSLPGVPAGSYTDVFSDMTYDNGIWLAYKPMAGQIIRSTDGINWTGAGYNSGGGFWTTDTDLRDIKYGNGKWIAVGLSSSYYVSTDNGLTWTKNTFSSFPTGTLNMYTIVTDGNGKWIAAGYSDVFSVTQFFKYSDDNGVTFSNRSINFVSRVFGSIYLPSEDKIYLIGQQSDGTQSGIYYNTSSIKDTYTPVNSLTVGCSLSYPKDVCKNNNNLLFIGVGGNGRSVVTYGDVPVAPTPTVTPTPTPTPTVTPSITVSPTVTPSITVSPTVTPSVTITPTRTPAATATPTPTPTVTPTVTPTKTVTPTVSPPAPSPTATPSATPTITPTVTPTQTVTPTATVTPTPSLTPGIPYNQQLAIVGRYQISKNNSSHNYVLTSANTFTNMNRVVGVSENGQYFVQFRPQDKINSLAQLNAQETYTFDSNTWPYTLDIIGASPAPTRTPTPTPTYTPIETVTNTPTQTKTPTATPSATPTITPTVTPTQTATPTVTPSITVTPTVTPTITITPTVTPTPGLSPSPTPSITPTKTVTPTVTPTKTVTPTITPTKTVTPTVTPSVSPTKTVTPTVTPSVSPTKTVTPTVTPSITVTPTVTPTVSPFPVPSHYYRIGFSGNNNNNPSVASSYINTTASGLTPSDYTINSAGKVMYITKNISSYVCNANQAVDIAAGSLNASSHTLNVKGTYLSTTTLIRPNNNCTQITFNGAPTGPGQYTLFTSALMTNNLTITTSTPIGFQQFSYTTGSTTGSQNILATIMAFNPTEANLTYSTFVPLTFEMNNNAAGAGTNVAGTINFTGTGIMTQFRFRYQGVSPRTILLGPNASVNGRSLIVQSAGSLYGLNTATVDSLLNAIARGGLFNGTLRINGDAGGFPWGQNRSSASDAAVATIKANGGTLYILNVLQ